MPTPRLIGLYSPYPQSGKSTVAEGLMRQRYTRVPFAETVKDMVDLLLHTLGYTNDVRCRMLWHDMKAYPLPELDGVTPRELLQTLGTDWGRNMVHPDLWVRLGMAKAKRELARGRAVVIDDVRFLNEAEAIRAAGGVMVQIKRNLSQGDPLPLHESEGQLNEYAFDLTILNNQPTAESWQAKALTALGSLSDKQSVQGSEVYPDERSTTTP